MIGEISGSISNCVMRPKELVAAYDTCATARRAARDLEAFRRRVHGPGGLEAHARIRRQLRRAGLKVEDFPRAADLPLDLEIRRHGRRVTVTATSRRALRAWRAMLEATAPAHVLERSLLGSLERSLLGFVRPRMMLAAAAGVVGAVGLLVGCAGWL